jgi:biotin transport system substrate-specific component
VPLSLGLLPVFLSGCALGSRNGALSQLIFILLGCAGLPVFSGFNGGIGAIAGPTGGYLVGYIAVAAISGISFRRRLRFISTSCYMIAGLAVCYLLGTLWFVWLNSVTFGSAFFMCVAPFIPLDVVKIAVAAAVGIRLQSLIADKQLHPPVQPGQPE